MGSSNDRGSNRFEVAIVLADLQQLSRQDSATYGSAIHPPISADRSKSTHRSYHRNQQYSIIGLTNAAGTLVERYSYTAYGTLGIYAASGTVRTTSTYANRYTYTGREYDPDLALYHFRARWYDPATGGFISRDPLGYVDGMSLYRGYFGVRGVDPSGNVDVKLTFGGFIHKRYGNWIAEPVPLSTWEFKGDQRGFGGGAFRVYGTFIFNTKDL